MFIMALYKVNDNFSRALGHFVRFEYAHAWVQPQYKMHESEISGTEIILEVCKTLVA